MGQEGATLAPGAPPELAALVAMVKANPMPKRPPPVSLSDRVKTWRRKVQAAGGHVTNVVLSPAAWQRVQDARQGPRMKGTTADAINDLLASSVVVSDGTLEHARQVLLEYPQMGSVDEAIRVAVGHLLFRIRQDPDYIIATE